MSDKNNIFPILEHFKIQLCFLIGVRIFFFTFFYFHYKTNSISDSISSNGSMVNHQNVQGLYQVLENYI